MKVLITSGSTNVMIDQVRCISNIFKGKTGNAIARFFNDTEEVTIITSSPESFKDMGEDHTLKILPYKTYDELYSLMKQEITTGNYDIVIHSAAVSDYKVEGTYEVRQTYQNFILDKLDSSKKISSNSKELYLKLVPTEKIIDKIKTVWGFKGKVVKFKLQVGISESELVDIATKSMNDSKSDFIVANCLEWAKEKAFIIKPNSYDSFTPVSRDELPKKLHDLLVINK
jgi:phosphopantothenate-cysteine ligase/phosphopantothenoylcysteine decarboxylase/phosphopantothenate--cysteine ligase